MRRYFWAALCGIAGLVGSPAVARESAAIAPGPESVRARQPQVAVGPSGAVHVTFGVGNAIYCVNSSDGGKHFAPPVKVAEHGVMSLGMRRGPRVAATGRAVAIAAVCGSQGGGRDGDVLVWRSIDGGTNWAGPVRVNRVPGSAREGLHDLAASADGRLYCVWLDLRDGKMEVFGALSTDGGATWGEDRLVYRSPDGFVCQCCQPSACFDGHGKLHVLWRNQLGGDRDMFLTSSGDGGRTFDTPRKLGLGTWTLKACPMDGGGLAADAAGTVQTVWRRQQTIYRCADGKPEESLGTGEQGRAARGRDGVWLTWITKRPGTLLVLAPGAKEPTALAERALDPAIASSTDGRGPVVLVWEEPGADGGPIRASVLSP
jgi:hypothetical protein